MNRYEELGNFFRAKRASLQPTAEEIALKSGRRRVKGLRREEVSFRADISTEQYTKIEQGRANFSKQTLIDLTNALELTQSDREYVFNLVFGDDVMAPLHQPQTVPPTLQQVLDALEPNPAYITDDRLFILAWNQTAVKTFTAFGDLNSVSVDERHVIWHLFTNPDARSFIVNWESHAKIVLSNFRVNARRYTNEAWFIQLVERLENISPEFRKWWSQHEVEKLPTSRREFNHPDVGRLVRFVRVADRK